MAVRSREYVGIAEGIKSHEISTKRRIENLNNTINELSSYKNSLEWEISSLEARIDAAESRTDEEGNPDPDYGLISQLESQKRQVESDLKKTEDDLDKAHGELREATDEFEQVMEEKERTLFEIQERARNTSANISKAGSMVGAYSGVGTNLQSAFQASFDSLSQAANILDGSVGGVGGGYGGRGSASGGRSNGGSGSSAYNDTSTSPLSAFIQNSNGDGSYVPSPSDFHSEQSGRLTPATSNNFNYGNGNFGSAKAVNYSSSQSENSYANSSFLSVSTENVESSNKKYQSEQATANVEKQLGIYNESAKSEFQNNLFELYQKSNIYAKKIFYKTSTSVVERLRNLGFENINLRGIPTKTQELIAESFEELTVVFPFLRNTPISISVREDMSEDAPASTGFDKNMNKVYININPSWFANNSAKEEIKNLTVNKKWAGYGEKSIFIHEIGHVIHLLLDAKRLGIEVGKDIRAEDELNDKLLKDLQYLWEHNITTNSIRDKTLYSMKLSDLPEDAIEKLVSYYADKDGSECFSECLADVFTSSTPNQFSINLVNEFNKQYKEASKMAKDPLPQTASINSVQHTNVKFEDLSKLVNDSVPLTASSNSNQYTNLKIGELSKLVKEVPTEVQRPQRTSESNDNEQGPIVREIGYE